jgi:hypothetical protein
VILGHSARSEIRHRGEGGDGLALTGLVLGWLSTAGWALVVTLLLIAALTTGRRSRTAWRVGVVRSRKW